MVFVLPPAFGNGTDFKKGIHGNPLKGPRLDSYAQFAAPSSDEALYCVLGAVVQFNFNKPVVTYTHLLTAQAVGGGRNY